MRSQALESQRSAYSLTGTGRDELVSAAELEKLRSKTVARLDGLAERAGCASARPLLSCCNPTISFKFLTTKNMTKNMCIFLFMKR